MIERQANTQVFQMSKYYDRIAEQPVFTKKSKIMTADDARVYGRFVAVSKDATQADIYESVPTPFQAIALSAYQAKLNVLAARNNKGAF